MESKVVDNFLKGLISRPADDKIADNAFSDCMNIELSDKFLPKSVKGKIKVNSAVLANSSCQGMTIYNNKELGSLMVVACGGYLYYSPLNTDNFLKYKIDNNGTLEDVKIDPDIRVRFAQYNDRIFVFTGKYPVIENLSFSDACILVLYKNTATYINRDSFYAWTKSGQIFYTLSATPANGDVIFTDLYRSKLTATVSSYDSGTDKFTDSDNAEYSRTSSSDKVDVNIPQGLKIGFIHQERLFGLGSIEDDNGVYWSQPYDPTRWTPTYGLNYDTVGKDDGEVVTGGASFGGAYVYIFKQHNVYRYLTSGDIDQWTSNKVDTTYGCVAHETIRLFNGFLTYLSPDGVAQLNGNSAVLIDEQIKDKTTNVSVGSDIEIERSYSTEKFYDLNTVIGDYNGVTGNNWNNNPYHLPSSIEVVDNSLQQKTTVFDVFARGQNLVYWKYTPKVTKTYTKIKLFSVTKLRESEETFQLSIYSTAPTSSGSGTLLKSSYDTNDPHEFTLMEPVTLNQGTTYYFSISSNSFSDGIANQKVLAVTANYYTNGSIKLVKNNTTPVSYTVTDVDVMPIMVDDNHTEQANSNMDDSLAYYNSTQYQLNANGYDMDIDLDIAAFASNIDSFESEIVVMLGFYSTSATTWNNIDSNDIYSYTIKTSQYQQHQNVWNFKRSIANCKEYLQVRIFFKQGVSCVYQFKIRTKQTVSQSVPLQITGITDLPKSWGISQFTRTGSDDVDNKATVYMRSGNDTTELNNANFYEINNNEQIPSTIGLKCLVQFKIVFPAGSDNEVNLIKIFYYTKMTVTKVCAYVWKDKYRLNMPADNSSSENAVEYIYDKAGYWTIKNNENNFDYCASVNDLFSCSGNNGIVYKKETGYKNDGADYESYFVTKRFVLSDFENLYRKFKVRYVSSAVNVTVGVSVDGEEFINYEIVQNTNLIEVIKTLCGIVRGQSIRFKFSWQANESTQIHNLVWYWKVLRHLNIG